jgi:hypothetical protein
MAGMARRRRSSSLGESVAAGALLSLVAWAFLVAVWKWSGTSALALIAILWAVGIRSAWNTRSKARGGKAPADRQRNLGRPFAPGREPIPARLRHEVMARDGYKCVYCGRGPADGVTLQIDHRIPLSRGGRTTEPNLATACDQCNLGKSNLLRPSDIAAALGRDPTAEELETILRHR